MEIAGSGPLKSKCKELIKQLERKIGLNCLDGLIMINCQIFLRDETDACSNKL